MRRKLLFVILAIIGAAILTLGIGRGMLEIIHGFASQI